MDNQLLYLIEVTNSWNVVLASLAQDFACSELIPADMEQGQNTHQCWR